MAPIGLPESFGRRRRSRADSYDAGDTPAMSGTTTTPIILDGKCCPSSSPKLDTHRYTAGSKSPDPVCRHASISSSRDTLPTSDGECETELTVERALEKQSLFRDLCQTQLSLWTFTVSTLLTYFWQKRVNFRSVLFAACAVALSVLMSGLLAAVVMAAHLFNSDFAESFGGFNEWIRTEDDTKHTRLIRRQSSSFRKTTGKRNGASSGAATPRNADKFHQTKFWQKNVSNLDRAAYIRTSRS